MGLLLVAASLVTCVSAALAAPTSDRYIVVLKDDVAHPANVAQRHEENRGAEVGHVYGSAIEGYSAELAPTEVKAIRQDPTVDYVVPDGVMHADSQVPSTGFNRIFAPGNPNLDIDEVDDVRSDVDVAILDTGVAYHPDLNVVSRVNCVGATHVCVNGGEDAYGHGSHVAGIVGALDNNFGVVGTAPGARIWSVKVLNNDGNIESYYGQNDVMSDVLAGVNWVTARSDQIEVVNMSLGCQEYLECDPKPMREAIAASVNKGVVYVVSAGNDDVNVMGQGSGVTKVWPYIPASFPDVITVSAIEDSDGAPGGTGGSPSCKYSGGTFTNENVVPHQVIHLEQDDYLAKFSNWGPAVDIAAPGTCITSTYPGGGYGTLSGTSQSAPFVTGAAANLAAAKNPNNRTEVEAIRTFLRGLGNYNWTDVHQDRNNPKLLPPEFPLVGDGSYEPLLQMGEPPTSPPPPNQPAIAIGTATQLTETSTVLTGTVNPQGHDGRYRFECGLLGVAGYTIVPNPEGAYFGSGNSRVPVSGTIGGLTPGATYHCRMAAWNVGPLVYTGDLTFTTPKMTSYVPPGAPAPLRQDNGNIDVFTRLLGVGDELDFTRATSGMWTAADLTPAGQPKMGASSAVLRMKNGAMHAFAINKSGDIICHYRTGTEPWNYLNLSAYAGATLKFDPTTTPSAVESGSNEVGVYARAVNGDLVSLERRANGTWFMWNESEHTATHPTIAGSPAAVVLDNPGAYANTGLIVFARNAANQLVSFNRNTVGEWTPYNVSEKTGVNINASPSAVQLDPAIYAGSGLGVYTTNASNDLLEFSRASSGTWTIYNVTQNIAGKPTVTGPVAPIRLSPNLYAGSVLGVYARTTDNDLVGFDRQANGGWYFYNVSAYNGFPKISSSPSVLSLNPSQYFGSGLQVHARSTASELLSYDRFMDGGWQYYNETANVPGHQKVE
jgi:subtilisin family serine protease